VPIFVDIDIEVQVHIYTTNKLGVPKIVQVENSSVKLFVKLFKIVHDKNGSDKYFFFKSKSHSSLSNLQSNIVGFSLVEFDLSISKSAIFISL
jgi:hypothetical protein